MSEFDRIARYFAPLTGAAGLGLKDDAALIPPCGEAIQWVITTDAMAAGVHFLEGDTGAQVAQRLMRSNLSDIAAMGATPKYYQLTCALTPQCSDEWLRDFYAALQQEQAKWCIELTGGDTISQPGRMVLSITMIGQVPAGKALLRSAAKAGDTLYVSGTIGDGHLGLKAAQGELQDCDIATQQYLHDRFYRPTPRIVLGQTLHTHGVRAAMDISDGLLADARHLAQASGVDIQIEAAAVPLSAAAQYCVASGGVTPLELCAGGDDYELLFTGPAGLATTLSNAECPVTAIGRVMAGKGEITVLNSDLQPIPIPRWGYEHGKQF